MVSRFLNLAHRDQILNYCNSFIWTPGKRISTYILICPRMPLAVDDWQNLRPSLIFCNLPNGRKIYLEPNEENLHVFYSLSNAWKRYKLNCLSYRLCHSNLLAEPNKTNEIILKLFPHNGGRPFFFSGKPAHSNCSIITYS
jgi:hypothetical protein